ncbi:MAG: beta-phosphoglucomutase [Tyzzerella sp.]|nr:beta-phosphoglucomutase [Tyzzerella sp.]
MNKTGFIFDLDGVIVDTAKYHYLAWKELAAELNIPFTIEDNERLKGVSRLQSFEIILEIGGRTMSDEEKEYYCTKKNNLYKTFLETLKKEEVLPGVRNFLEAARAAKIPTALGSASKNAAFILEKLDLMDLLDVIIDGTLVSAAKPDPEVFLKGAEALSLDPADCIVFEDSFSGIEAAHRGGMKAIGVVTKENLPEADEWITGFDGLMPEDILKMLDR